MKLFRLIAILMLPALVTGCAQVTYPEQDLAERLAYDAAARARYQLDPDWWLVYNDPRLNLLVEQALRNNLDLAQAALSVNRALYQARLISGDLAPSFSGGADASARKNIETGGRSARSAGADLSLSYELDLWGRVADAASAQEWELLATVEDREAARLALINSVVDGYFNLAYLEDAIRATELNLRNYRVIERTVLAKFRTGKVAAVEPAQARQSILSAENSLLDYQAQRQTARLTLRNLLNLKPHESLNLDGLTLGKMQPPSLELDIPLSVLANRPDLKSAEFRMQRAFKNVEESEKAWLPSISLGTALSSSGGAVSTALDNPVAGATVSVNLPFLDWNSVLWNLRISETDFEQVRLDFERALTTALNEVDNAFYNYDSSRKTLANTRKKFVYDQRISDYYRDRYDAGAGELSDWLGALNTLNSSRLSSLSDLYRTIQYANLTCKAMAGRYTDLTPPAPEAQ
jgi:NodT family efflux transporter outer membrane factor (OMF) lipoprotein